MDFSLDIPVSSLYLIVAAALCIVLVVAIYLYRVRNVAAFQAKADKEIPNKSDGDFLPVSVVVYSQGDSEHLARMLDTLLKQDYPAAFEVIVVNDGESTDVRDTVRMMRASNPNLYLTFTPEGVLNLSRKKLGITLGIKAARYDIVALTTTAVEIESDRWLRHIMAPFSPTSPVDIVLGYAYIHPDEDHALGARQRAFDYVAESVRWLGAAIGHRPFRGSEYNIAYRKKLFLDAKGFSRSLNLHKGDDDIFISQIATPQNTAVQLTATSMVRLRQGNHPRLFTERVLSHKFTETFIPNRPRILMPLSSWLQLAALVALIVAVCLAPANLTVVTAAVALILIMATVDILIWRKAMTALRARPLLLTIPWMVVTRPLRQLFANLRMRMGHQKKYTWD